MESLAARHKFTDYCRQKGKHSHSLWYDSPSTGIPVVSTQVHFPDCTRCNAFQRRLYCLMEEGKAIRYQVRFSSMDARMSRTRAWLYHCHDFRNRFGELLVPSELRELWEEGERSLGYRPTVWSIDCYRCCLACCTTAAPCNDNAQNIVKVFPRGDSVLPAQSRPVITSMGDKPYSDDSDVDGSDAESS